MFMNNEAPTRRAAPPIPEPVLRHVQRGEFRLGFDKFLSNRRETTGPRGLFLALLRHPRDVEERIVIYRERPSGALIIPTSLDELAVTLLRQNVPDRLLQAAADLWCEFRLSAMTPDEVVQAKAQAAADRAKRTYLARMERNRLVAEAARAAAKERVAEWLQVGRRTLDMPVPMRRLVPPEEAEFVDPHVMALRNRVSGREFLHEVLALPDLDIRSERFAVMETLDAMPGWRKLGPQRHRGQMQIVYQREGATDGKPTVLRDKPASGRRRVL